MSVSFSKIRKADLPTRQELLRHSLALGPEQEALERCTLDEEMTGLADVMIEQALGYFPVPLGLAGGFVIDGKDYVIPMASEEPSVLAAASFAASRIARNGGFETWALPPVMTANVYLDGFASDQDRELAAVRIRAKENDLKQIMWVHLASMEKRGGGLRAIRVEAPDHDPALKVSLDIDVQNAMGANLLNTCAESLRPELEKISGAKVLMAILSNRSPNRSAGARCRIRVEDLARAGFSGIEAASRIVRASEIALRDPDRAVTHNKGIMNGISALALASANDTRAIEAGVHAWAARNGSYQGLGSWKLEGYQGTPVLTGELELPLAFASTGGALGIHPGARLALALLEHPSGTQLARIAVALGLAQNFAALGALTGEGIQGGHMRLHGRRLAWLAGARGKDLEELASSIADGGIFNIEAARSLFSRKNSATEV